MIFKLQNVYVDDSEDKLFIDGYNALHHFMRLEQNNEVSIKRLKLTDPVTGKNMDRLELTLSKRKNTPTSKPIVKLFDESRNDVQKESEFKKQRVILEQIIATDKQKIKELEAKIKELEKTDVSEKDTAAPIDFVLKREPQEGDLDEKVSRKRKNSTNSD